MRIEARLLIATVLLLPAIALAADGLSFVSVTLLPQNESKIVAAQDAYMASPAGQQFKGRLVLLRHLADGADPATHTFASAYHSATELAVYMDATSGTADRRAFFDAVVPISSVVTTGRSTSLKSWGDASDVDKIWVNIALNVTDPAAFIAALDTWLASPTGKTFPGQGYLSVVSFGGAGAPSHVVALGYASMAEMESYLDALPGDADYAAFQRTVASVSTRVGTSLSQVVKAWGPATTASFRE
jgi:hypothetical protein